MAKKIFIFILIMASGSMSFAFTQKQTNAIDHDLCIMGVLYGACSLIIPISLMLLANDEAPEVKDASTHQEALAETLEEETTDKSLPCETVA